MKRKVLEISLNNFAIFLLSVFLHVQILVLSKKQIIKTFFPPNTNTSIFLEDKVFAPPPLTDMSAKNASFFGRLPQENKSKIVYPTLIYSGLWFKVMIWYYKVEEFENGMSGTRLILRIKLSITWLQP